jgi:hypothetical protein
MNDIPVPWKKIKKGLPRVRNLGYGGESLLGEAFELLRRKG